MSDLNDFHEFFSDEDVMRYWYHPTCFVPQRSWSLTVRIHRSNPPYTELSQTEKYLRNMIEAKWNGLSDFVIEYAPPSQPPKVVGKIGLWDGHEIGFMLNRGFQGQGLMKQAMKRFLHDLWSNEEMKSLQEIVADVDPRNNASVGLLKKFGFKETGYRERTFETHIGWCDSLDLQLERPNTT
ncbi:MAG: hypothetical protein L6R41_000312 [Letrouitia leprolyta]|nr:MAG: hypothetical protein L6R41_000312 [Letrouitia leprolyta]